MSAHASTGPSRHRTDIWFGLGVLVAVAILAWVVITVQEMSHDLRAANDARDQLAAQVQQLGGRPVAGPPGSRGEPGPSVTGRPGADGHDGTEGPTGPPGPSGKPGAAGADGSDGTAGNVGADGADGPPGPAGPPGPQGEAGPAGPPGADGAAGNDGADGKDGQTCPDGYSLQPLADDPDALVCRKDGAPAAPDGTPTPQSKALDPSRRQYP